MRPKCSNLYIDRRRGCLKLILPNLDSFIRSSSLEPTSGIARTQILTRTRTRTRVYRIGGRKRICPQNPPRLGGLATWAPSGLNQIGRILRGTRRMNNSGNACRSEILSCQDISTGSWTLMSFFIGRKSISHGEFDPLSSCIDPTYTFFFLIHISRTVRDVNACESLQIMIGFLVGFWTCGPKLQRLKYHASALSHLV